VREGGLYSLLVDPMENVHSNGKLEEASRFEEACAWKEVTEPSSTPIKDSLIASCVDEDVRSFHLKDFPSMIKENVEVDVPYLEAQDHVGVFISSMRVIVPPRRYASHVPCISSICELPTIQTRRGVMMRLISSTSLPIVHWRRGVIL
jgi:hypothetical protein